MKKNMDKQSITIISSTVSTAEATSTQLKEVFRDLVVIKSVVFTNNPPYHSVTDDLVMITNNLIVQEAMEYIAPEANFLVADRTININTVGKLYELPENADVMVCNVTKDLAFEAMEQLTERGIHHLRLYPYWPGMDGNMDFCQYAITFGEAQIIPNGNYAVIDLGTRPVDITTYTKVAIMLNLFEELKRTISSSFMRSGIELSYTYYRQLKKNQDLTDNLQVILNRFRRSIVMVDGKGKILFFNPRAQRLLRIEGMKSTYVNLIMETKVASGENFFFEIEDRNYHIEAIGGEDYRSENTIIVINDIENIENIEKDYRTMLLKDGLVAQYTFDDIICQSEAMKLLIQKAKQFAKSNSTIAIYGESGCGKELFAQAIHNASGRKKEAFVAVNFAAISPSLSEAELFGYVDGAFTGAKKGGKKGLFELAHKGTIFLDEIGDCSSEIQKKILRVIQERKVMPIGGNRLIPIDIRIITATNRDLYEMVKNKEFREDLYYRLNVLPIKISSIRDRKEDILPLLFYFLDDLFGLSPKAIPPRLQEMLMNYSWRGNTRELKNVAEYVANCIISGMDWEEDLSTMLEDVIEGSDGMETTDHMKRLVMAMEMKQDLRSLYEILQLIGKEPFYWSRRSVTETMRGSDLSESKVKKTMSVLKDFGLIQSKTGKGSYIKQLGKEFLDYYERNLI